MKNSVFSYPLSPVFRVQTKKNGMFPTLKVRIFYK